MNKEFRALKDFIAAGTPIKAGTRISISETDVQWYAEQGVIAVAGIAVKPNNAHNNAQNAPLRPWPGCGSCGGR